MSMLGPSPFEWVRLDSCGSPVDPDVIAAIGAMLAVPGVDDLVVFAHGWKNDEADATKLYGTLWGHACAKIAKRPCASIAVCGVLWPAKAFRTETDGASAATLGGGALAAGGRAARRDLSDSEFETMLTDVDDVMDGDAGPKVGATARAAAADPDRRHATSLHSAIVDAMPLTPDDPETAAHRELLLRLDPKLALDVLREPPSTRLRGGVVQGAIDVGSAVAGTRAAIARLLNLLTYFEMKRRAGVVGSALGGTIFPSIATARPVRLHLVGHSFGARLSTASAAAFPGSRDLKLETLTLLQGAFSHNALSRGSAGKIRGVFPDLVGSPPAAPVTIVATHTHNDLACTLAYAIASRLSNDIARGIGDAADAFGAMGANGAQNIEADSLAPEDAAKAFRPVVGKVNNVLADDFIKEEPGIDAHNNVAGPECGRLLARVIDGAS